MPMSDRVIHETGFDTFNLDNSQLSVNSESDASNILDPAMFFTGTYSQECPYYSSNKNMLAAGDMTHLGPQVSTSPAIEETLTEDEPTPMLTFSSDSPNCLESTDILFADTPAAADMAAAPFDNGPQAFHDCQAFQQQPFPPATAHMAAGSFSNNMQAFYAQAHQQQLLPPAMSNMAAGPFGNVPHAFYDYQAYQQQPPPPSTASRAAGKFGAAPHALHASQAHQQPFQPAEFEVDQNQGRNRIQNARQTNREFPQATQMTRPGPDAAPVVVRAQKRKRERKKPQTASEEDAKRTNQLERNRGAATKSRQKKKLEIERLEERARAEVITNQMMWDMVRECDELLPEIGGWLQNREFRGIAERELGLSWVGVEERYRAVCTTVQQLLHQRHARGEGAPVMIQRIDPAVALQLPLGQEGGWADGEWTEFPIN
ncbi:uncharacterized protein L3040_004323 [Drepanopeziza brunnea f. sp. 'multigermtubi']|uniref:uncharacterized protein n=1 Tax=Drepanopeziza brunnea f. sp. 'multigermtubi' TaxID=698441 RepID=UPI00238FFCE3|nr:hypothetical protein L3040_004323 [Drepanopeziza brunnea f. sp. 'multigermtubi']